MFLRVGLSKTFRLRLPARALSQAQKILDPLPHRARDHHQSECFPHLLVVNRKVLRAQCEAGAESCPS
jgi:hypothetical protein